MIAADRVLRDRMRAQRRDLPAAQRIAAAERIADGLLALPLLPTRGFVGGYWAVDGEVGLHALLMRLPATLAYCLPVLQDDHMLRFAAWRPGQPLATNRFGIPEPDVPSGQLLDPAAMALVIAPVVAFDRRGHRVGMGGGWYDRAFAFRRGAASPALVGAAYAMQEVDAIAARAWDVPMDAICTESGTILPSTGTPA